MRGLMIQARSTNVPSNVVLERLQKRFIEGLQAGGITPSLALQGCPEVYCMAIGRAQYRGGGDRHGLSDH
jgi:hypothetical protein